MTAADMNVLRRWVADGGCLLAWGDTSIHNEYLESGQGYWLGDVFGVARGRTARRKGLHAPDRSSGLPSFAVGRPLRPVAGGRKTVDAAELTPVGSAKVLLRWSDNTAAMVVNTYGKGTALLANFDPTRLEPADRDRLLGDLVRRYVGQVPGAGVDAPAEIEINLLAQKDRLLLHVLNYKHAPRRGRENHKGLPFLNVPARMVVPAGRKIRRLFAVGPDIEGRQVLSYRTERAGGQRVATFTIPRVDIYCVIVMELT